MHRTAPFPKFLPALSIALSVTVATAGAGHAASPAKEPEPGVRFHGNVVFLDAVLLAQMGVDGTRSADVLDMAAAVNRLTAFYHRSGYTLAEAQYRKKGRTWHVFIDEGRLDRIIIVGAGSLRTFMIRQAIHLPSKVFNKAQVEKDLAEVRRASGIPRIDYKVVELEDVQHRGFQLPDWIASSEFLPPAIQFEPRARYDLIVHVRASDWGTGLGYGLSYTSLGLEANADYSGESFLLDRDRQKLNVAAGGDRRSRIDNGNTYLAFTKGALEFDYYLPPVVGTWLRPHVLSNGAVTSWQRRDLPLEQYYLFREELSLNLGAEFVRNFMISIGGGVQWSSIFDTEEVPGRPAYPVDSAPYHRYFVAGNVEYVVDDTMLRTDQRHAAWLTASQYMGGRNGMGACTLEYQRTFFFGFDGLKLTTAGLYLWGSPTFHDEYPITWGPFHASLNQMYWVRKAAYQSADYGLSLYHEMVTLHLFAEGAVFGRVDSSPSGGRRGSNGESIAAAVSTGPGLSLVLYDSFLFTLTYAWGWATTGESSGDVGLSLRKVY